MARFTDASIYIARLPTIRMEIFVFSQFFFFFIFFYDYFFVLNNFHLGRKDT